MKKRRIILFGVDGGTWRILTPLIRDGFLKHFRELVHDGAHGILESTIPYITLPAWTSMFTGVNPGKHGITDYLVRVDGGFRVCTSSMREADTIWRIMSRRGREVILLNDPTSYPPEPIGIHVTGFLTPPSSKNYAYPPEIARELDKASGGYIPEIRDVYYKERRRNPEKAYEVLKDYAGKIFSAFRHIASNHEWDAASIIFTSTDRLQHFYWNKPRFIRDHYIQLDGYLKQVMDMASKEEANLVIASDHGFTETRLHLYLNSLLYDLGFLHPLKETTVASGIRRMGLSRDSITRILSRFPRLHSLIKKITPGVVKRSIPPKQGLRIDLVRSSAFTLTDMGVFLNRDGDLRRRLIGILKDLKEEGRTIIRSVLTREEVLWGPYIDRAPDIFVIPEEGVKIRTQLIPGKVLEPLSLSEELSSRNGDHDREGIFILHGPNVKRHGRAEDMKIWDIASLILSLMGLPIPSYFDGRPPSHLLKDVEIETTGAPDMFIGEKRIRDRLRKVRGKLRKKTF